MPSAIAGRMHSPQFAESFRSPRFASSRGAALQHSFGQPRWRWSRTLVTISSLILVCVPIQRESRHLFCAWSSVQPHRSFAISSASRARHGVAVSAGASALTSEDLLPAIKEGVAAFGAEHEWEESIAALQTATQGDRQALELALAKGYRWNAWVQLNKPSWMKPAVPDPADIREVLQWLTEGPLELGPKELRAGILASPQAYLSSPQKQYEESLATAPGDIRGDPVAFRKLLLREPWVLELTFNCGDLGGCGAQCGRCWRPAEHRLQANVEALSQAA